MSDNFVSRPAMAYGHGVPTRSTWTKSTFVERRLSDAEQKAAQLAFDTAWLDVRKLQFEAKYSTLSDAQKNRLVGAARCIANGENSLGWRNLQSVYDAVGEIIENIQQREKIDLGYKQKCMTMSSGIVYGPTGAYPASSHFYKHDASVMGAIFTLEQQLREQEHKKTQEHSI